MTDEQTYIPDATSAMIGAGRAYNTATELAGQLTGLFEHITGLQGGPPWGTSEAGDAFGHIYHTDKGGADFVLAHGQEVMTAITDTLANAATAIRDSTTVDENQAASFFQVSPDTADQLAAGNAVRADLTKQ